MPLHSVSSGEDVEKCSKLSGSTLYLDKYQLEPEWSKPRKCRLPGWIYALLSILYGLAWTAAIVAVLVWLTGFGNRPTTELQGNIWPSTTAAFDNATLGFGNVFVVRNISDPSAGTRTSFQKAADATHFKYSLIEPLPKQSSQQAGLHADGSSDAKFHLFNSHAEALKAAVQSEKPVSLILQDDADWNVVLRPQLKSVTDHLAKNEPRAWSTAAQCIPRHHGRQEYSDYFRRPDQVCNDDLRFIETSHIQNTDILWLARCNESTLPAGIASTASFNSLTYPQKLEQGGPYVLQQQMTLDAAPSRLAPDDDLPACTLAYAVSRDGAAKLIEHMRMRGPQQDLVDIMNDFCGVIGNHCGNVRPALFRKWHECENVDNCLSRTAIRPDGMSARWQAAHYAQAQSEQHQPIHHNSSLPGHADDTVGYDSKKHAGNSTQKHQEQPRHTQSVLDLVEEL